MAIDARNHIAPADGETPRRQAINDLSLSVNDIRTVVNATDRAQYVSSMTALGFGPSATRPLYVHRQDAVAGANLEVTLDGTTWRTYTAVPAMPAPKTATADGTVSELGNIIRDNVLGGYTFPAIAGFQYRIVLDNVLVNGTVAAIYNVQLRVVAGTAVPGGTDTLAAANQVPITTGGNAGRQPADLGGPWTCPATGTYTAAAFIQRNAAGSGEGRLISTLAPRSLYAHLLHATAA
jgi:hypothetical protein